MEYTGLQLQKWLQARGQRSRSIHISHLSSFAMIALPPARAAAEQREFAAIAKRHKYVVVKRTQKDFLACMWGGERRACVCAHTRAHPRVCTHSSETCTRAHMCVPVYTHERTCFAQDFPRKDEPTLTHPHTHRSTAAELISHGPQLPNHSASVPSPTRRQLEQETLTGRWKKSLGGGGGG